MCDCASEDDSEPKVKAAEKPMTNPDKLQSSSIKPCDCTSEESEPKIQIFDKVASNNENVQAGAINSCDYTSQDDSGSTTTESCDCTSEENADTKMNECDANNLKSPFAVVQVELSKSVLDLMSSTASSSTSCNCTSESSKDDRQQELRTCSDKDEPSCDCTSETSGSSKRSVVKEKKLEWTLAIIKPEAVMFRREIERIIEQAEGFVICQRRRLQLTPEQASEFYCDNEQQKDFARLIEYMSSNPIAVYVLCKVDAISEWRLLIGPTKVSDARVYAPDSIRARYGRYVEGDEMQNAVHGSFDEREAEREIHFFFPDCILEPLLRDEAAEEYLWKNLNDVLRKGLIKCCEEKPEDPVVWLGNWLLESTSSCERPKYLLRSTSNLND